jgi:sugar phosphate isomerase/epimerase
MRIVSLAALTILDAGPMGQIVAAAGVGFTHVGLRLMPLVDTDIRVIGAHEREIEDLLDAYDVGVMEIGVFPLKPSMDWPQVEAVVALGQRIGARHLVCPVEDPDHARRRNTLVRLCDLAAAAEMTALIEFNPYSACPNLAAAVGLVGDAQHPSAGLVIDALHLSRSGGKPADLKSVEPRLLQLVHFCDAPPPPDRSRSIDELRAESRTARLLPGEGSLWLDGLLDALPPDTPISVEAPSARDAQLPAVERASRALQATVDFLAKRGERPSTE